MERVTSRELTKAEVKQVTDFYVDNIYDDVVGPEVTRFIASVKRMLVTTLRGLIVGVCAYLLLSYHPDRQPYQAELAFILGALAVMNLTKWASALGMVLLVAIVILPHGFFVK